jgi:predicted phage terminase large subunit-like protein
MQTPTSEEGSIVKREWWNEWESEILPPVSYIIQSYDTAFSKKETADYSAISTWGVFRPTPDSPDCIILLDAQKDRWDFPELKRVAYEEYQYWDPDMVLIEAKASGTPLTHELRRLGIPVVNYSPTRGHDKSTRMHSVAPIFESGLVYAPTKKFAEEMIEECASFPFGKNDDLCDTMTQALMRFREGGLVSLNDDYEDGEKAPVRRVYY